MDGSICQEVDRNEILDCRMIRSGNSAAGATFLWSVTVELEICFNPAHTSPGTENIVYQQFHLLVSALYIIASNYTTKVKNKVDTTFVTNTKLYTHFCDVLGWLLMFTMVTLIMVVDHR